jgi:hypothetical protein
MAPFLAPQGRRTEAAMAHRDVYGIRPARARGCFQDRFRKGTLDESYSNV